jgi:hypothetical protein
MCRVPAASGRLLFRRGTADDLFFGQARVPPARFLGRLKAGIQSETEFLDAIGEALAFPPYYGHNWAALEDCLQDLEWMSAHQVVLLHQDVPALEKELAWRYLRILTHAVAQFRHNGEHELVAVFPPECEAEIRSLLTTGDGIWLPPSQRPQEPEQE